MLDMEFSNHLPIQVAYKSEHRDEKAEMITLKSGEWKMTDVGIVWTAKITEVIILMPWYRILSVTQLRAGKSG